MANHQSITSKSKFIEIINEESKKGENIVDIVYENNKVFQRQYTSTKLKNEKELMNFIQKLSIDEDFIMDKHTHEYVKFIHKKHNNIYYTIWMSDYFVEREIYRDMGKIQIADSNLLI